MQDSNYPAHGMDRRDMFKGTAAAGLALTVGVEAAFTAQSAWTTPGPASRPAVEWNRQAAGTRKTCAANDGECVRSRDRVAFPIEPDASASDRITEWTDINEASFHPCSCFWLPHLLKK